MNRHFLSLLALFGLIFGLLFQQNGLATGAQSTPESTTRQFYVWYMKKNVGSEFIMLDKQAYDYVARCTVDRLRDDYKHGRLPGDTDYFLKVQDYDERDWSVNMAIGHAIALDGAAVVPVTFGSRNKISVLVFLRKQDGV
jgi:hypothetical protein